MTLTTELNADQLRAVEHPGGPLLVLAGPGTGKTGAMIERISHLVGERDASPERVLALTFSRRAADEMRARVTARLPEAEKVEVRTFHSFALSVVRRHAGSLGLRSAPEIVPTNEQWALVSDILGNEDPASWGLPPGAFERSATVREVYDLMLRAQEHLLGPDRLRELGERTGRSYLTRAGTVLERYADRLRWGAKADYEGVVQYALRLLRPGGRAAEEICGLYDQVLVDEFQDTNRSQMELLRRLAPEESPNVFCVGDDAQSIYGFRGARIENVREFAQRFPGARQIQLRTNYHSAAHIVSLARYRWRWRGCSAIAGPPSPTRRWSCRRKPASGSRAAPTSTRSATQTASHASRRSRGRGLPPRGCGRSWRIRLNEEEGFDRTLTASWNIVPWALRENNRNRKPTRADLERGEGYLRKLMTKLRLEVVVLCGGYAQRATPFFYKEYPELCVLHAPTRAPSP